MAPIFILGENPGFQEVQQGKPFIGPAGRKLMEFLAAARIDVSDCRFSNTVHCREDRKPATPTPMEIDSCHDVLVYNLKIVRPKVVVALGNTAISQFFPDFKVGKIHGTLRQYPVDETLTVTVLPTYHPSAVLHGNKEIIPIIIEDLAKVNSIL